MKAKAVVFSSTFNAKSFHFIALLIGAFSAPAQTGVGIVNFGNPSTSDDRRIWTGGAGGLVRAAGTGYRVALYWGPQGTPESGLIQVGASVGFLTGTAAGTFVGGSRTLSPLAQNGAVVTLQARGWVTIPGVPDTYEGALAAGLAGIGKGSVFDHKTKDPTNPLELANPIGVPIATGGDPGWCGS